MALGHCGKVSDFVVYCREVVGTPLAFEGNDATAHGIRTESKARCLYEFITQQAVANGGFFLSADGVLGASPDGQVHLRGEDGELITYLLEIKSPMRALYDASKKPYQPYGIPPAYMCQMQGQMALSNTPWCDFFVFLERPVPCCSCIRVFRSRQFWDWAEPKLRLVARWISSGLPSVVDRSFDFPEFNFSTVRVEPVIPPFNIAAQCCLFDRDPSRFPVFFFRPRQLTACGEAELPVEFGCDIGEEDGFPVPRYFSENYLQRMCGLYTIFCLGLDPAESLQLVVHGPDGQEDDVCFLVDSVDWDAGEIRGVAGMCCADALVKALSGAPVEDATVTVLKFRNRDELGLSKARKLLPLTTKFDDHSASIGCPRCSTSAASGGRTTSPSKSLPSSQPSAATSQRSLHDALQTVACAVDCRGVVFAAEPGAPLQCMSLLARAPSPQDMIAKGAMDAEQLRERKSSTGVGRYWAMFVDAFDLCLFCREVGHARSPDYEELLRRLFDRDGDGAATDLVVCIVVTRPDDHAQTYELETHVLPLVVCPHAVVVVPGDVGWGGTVELLRRRFLFE